MTGLQPHGTPAPARLPHVSDLASAPHNGVGAPPTMSAADRMPRIASLEVVVSQPATVAGSESRSRWRTVYEPVKYTLDFGFGAVLLVLFAPVIALAALAVRATSAGPAFYSQTRAGKGGRLFRIYKLRTMFHDCERVSGARWSVPGDSRVTPLGSFLRKTHLDELPQLLNVLKGDMSLVGPRPERPEIIKTLEKAIPRYDERLAVRPGVTGLAQLRLPADTSVESVREKLVFDLHYIQVMGPWLDVRLTACTLFKMCKLPLAFVLSFFRVPGDRAVEPTRQLLTAEPI